MLASIAILVISLTIYFIAHIRYNSLCDIDMNSQFDKEIRKDIKDKWKTLEN